MKSENREAKFVFEMMDVDQARLFSMLHLDDVLEGMNPSVLCNFQIKVFLI